jgi:hypothetical protein
MIKTYPAVLFVARHGRRIAVMAAAVIVLVTTAVSAAYESPALLLLGPPIAGLGWALTRLAAELIEVIAETLLPR